MAGTALSKKQNTSIINIINKTANLNASLNASLAKKCCCLLVQQAHVVQSNNSSKCNLNNRLMKHNTTNICPNSSCRLDDRISTNYSYSIKTIRQNRQQKARQRPLTLSLAVIIMSLTILLLQLPAMVHSKTFHAGTVTNEDKESAAETSVETDSKLLLSQAKDEISFLTDDSDNDSLDLIDVLRYVQRSQQHHRERRKRLRKRHSGDLIITKYLSETDDNMEWKNPCNVHHVNEEGAAREVSKQQMYQYLKKFEHDVGMDYAVINAIANTININDMADWSKHDELYQFLPKLNANGGIALSRWYRYMQVYVASFGYLARSQYHFDQKKRMFMGQTSLELDKLLASARFILCELETTINGSSPNNNLKKLRTINRQIMNNRLNFVTKHQLANGGVVPANTVDLKFAKYSYYQFLLNMQKILQQKLRNKAKKYGIVDSMEENSSQSVVVGDNTSSLDFSSIFKSDSGLSMEESVEMLLKPTKKPQVHRRRIHKRKNPKSAQA